jgi:hypothetical protein
MHSLRISLLMPAILLLTSFGFQQSGGSGTMDPNGPPNLAGGTEARRFIVWRDNNWWQIVTMTGGQPHRFTGRIAVRFGSIFSAVPNASLEILPGNSNPLTLDPSGRVLNFDFTTSNELCGLYFYSDAAELDFDLQIDGSPIPGNILIGGNSAHPESIPFTLLNEPKPKSILTEPIY